VKFLLEFWSPVKLTYQQIIYPQSFQSFNIDSILTNQTKFYFYL